MVISILRICALVGPDQPRFGCHNQTDPLPKLGHREIQIRPLRVEIGQYRTTGAVVS
jgi:hypothetical protein